MSLPPHIEQLFDKMDGLVLRIAARPLYAAFFAVAAAFWLYGVGLAPYNHYYELSLSPFERYTHGAYIQDSLLLPLLAHFTGLNSSMVLFTVFTLVVFALSFFLFAGFKNLSPQARFFGMLALVVSPASLVVLSWPGMPDSLTVLFTVLACFSGSIFWLFLAGLLGVANHPMFLLIGAALIALRLARRENAFGRRHALALGLGMLAGYAFVQGFIAYYQIDLFPSRLDIFRLTDPLDWVVSKTMQAPMAAFSLYRGFWLLMPICLLYNRKSYAVVFGLTQLGAAGVTLFMFDTTRVFSLLTLGPLLHLLVSTVDGSDPGYQPLLRRILLTASIFSLFLPVYFIWNDQTILAGSASLPAIIVNLLFHR
jgi:hypothetical protein